MESWYLPIVSSVVGMGTFHLTVKISFAGNYRKKSTQRETLHFVYICGRTRLLYLTLTQTTEERKALFWLLYLTLKANSFIHRYEHRIFHAMYMQGNRYRSYCKLQSTIVSPLLPPLWMLLHDDHGREPGSSQWQKRWRSLSLPEDTMQEKEDSYDTQPPHHTLLSKQR